MTASTTAEMTSDDDVVTIDDIKRARDIIMASPLKVRKTPLLKNMTSYFPELDPSLNLNMKLESLQSTGMFFFVNACCTCRFNLFTQYISKLYLHVYSINSFDVCYSAFLI